MNIKKRKKYIAIIAICTSIVFLLIFSTQSLFYKGKACFEEKRETERKVRIRDLNYDISLKDSNDLHLKYAQRNGLKRIFETDEEFLVLADSLRKNGFLVHISDKRNYALKRLTHSHPYLTREARELLGEISTRFSKKQIEEGLIPYKIIVTSLLRTNQSQCYLRRCNRNATQETTAHLYGTTFDISSRKFVKEDFFGKEYFCYQLEYKKILEEVLQELRYQGRCVVVREYKQACYHITVVN